MTLTVAAGTGARNHWVARKVTATMVSFIFVPRFFTAPVVANDRQGLQTARVKGKPAFFSGRFRASRSRREETVDIRASNSTFHSSFFLPRLIFPVGR
jgi:hypothetical protein